MYKLTVKITALEELIATGLRDDDGNIVFRRDDDNRIVMPKYIWIRFIRELGKSLKLPGVRVRDRDLEYHLDIQEKFVNIECAETHMEPTRSCEVIPAGATCQITFVTNDPDVLEFVVAALNLGEEDTPEWYLHRHGFSRFKWNRVNLEREGNTFSTRRYFERIECIMRDAAEKQSELLQLTAEAKVVTFEFAAKCDEALRTRNEALAKDLVTESELGINDIWQHVEALRNAAVESMVEFDKKIKLLKLFAE